MSKAGEKLLRAAREAVAVAKGEQPAARITIQGHTYVPLAEYERLRAVLAAAIPFAEHNWYDAELEDDSCKLTRHSGPITVGHWRALGRAINAANQQLTTTEPK